MGKNQNPTSPLNNNDDDLGQQSPISNNLPIQPISNQKSPKNQYVPTPQNQRLNPLKPQQQNQPNISRPQSPPRQINNQPQTNFQSPPQMRYNPPPIQYQQPPQRQQPVFVVQSPRYNPNTRGELVSPVRQTFYQTMQSPSSKQNIPMLTSPVQQPVINYQPRPNFHETPQKPQILSTFNNKNRFQSQDLSNNLNNNLQQNLKTEPNEQQKNKEDEGFISKIYHKFERLVLDEQQPQDAVNSQKQPDNLPFKPRSSSFNNQITPSNLIQSRPSFYNQNTTVPVKTIYLNQPPQQQNINPVLQSPSRSPLTQIPIQHQPPQRYTMSPPRNKTVQPQFQPIQQQLNQQRPSVQPPSQQQTPVKFPQAQLKSPLQDPEFVSFAPTNKKQQEPPQTQQPVQQQPPFSYNQPGIQVVPKPQYQQFQPQPLQPVQNYNPPQTFKPLSSPQYVNSPQFQQFPQKVPQRIQPNYTLPQQPVQQPVQYVPQQQPPQQPFYPQQQHFQPSHYPVQNFPNHQSHPQNQPQQSQEEDKTLGSKIKDFFQNMF